MNALVEQGGKLTEQGGKLNTEESERLILEMWDIVVKTSIGKFSREIMQALEGNIPKRYADLLLNSFSEREEGQTNLQGGIIPEESFKESLLSFLKSLLEIFKKNSKQLKIDLKGESICENSELSPIAVILQFYFRRLTKNSKLELDEVNLNNKPTEIIKNIHIQALEKLGIYECIKSNPNLEKILSNANIIVGLRKFYDINPELFKRFANNESLSSMPASNGNIISELEKLLEESEDLFQVIINNESLFSIFDSKYSVSRLKKLWEEKPDLVKSIVDNRGLYLILSNEISVIKLGELWKEQPDLIKLIGNSGGLWLILKDKASISALKESWEKDQRSFIEANKNGKLVLLLHTIHHSKNIPPNYTENLPEDLELSGGFPELRN